MKRETKNKIKDLFSKSKYFILIENDLFDISNRLKEIDEGYFIVFNTNKNKYEVHNAFNKMGTFCFMVPYKHLDIRTYYYCLKTRIENSDKLIEEMNRKNKEKEKQNKKYFENEMKARAYDTRSIFMKEERM
ncbi:hypothetical protein [Anaerofustis stercorihominis]|uniref:Uncharacterized protein n=1 Tax=Anaerofustis stercorihominis TaxID=214853 RepID=A0A3E3E3L1_9FIRM|nr:hypothetical protein [Anaerofustis stercorihominis]RGD75498.1 hypothetical protein DW687_04005 [Anaerofustis stercorihominis]